MKCRLVNARRWWVDVRPHLGPLLGERRNGARRRDCSLDFIDTPGEICLLTSRPSEVATSLSDIAGGRDGFRFPSLEGLGVGSGSMERNDVLRVSKGLHENAGWNDLILEDGIC